MSLDYLTESNDIEDITLDIDGKPMPKPTGKIALIDADTLAYTACLNVEQAEALLPREFYTDKEWEEVIANPAYDEESNCIWTIDAQVVYDKAMEKLQRIYDKTGCREAEMHFTGGRKNFRYEVNPEYKSHRTDRVPTGLADLKQKLLDTFPGTLSTEWEADDIVVYKAMQEPEKYTLVAVDKDLLYAVPGIHFNYYESAKYNIEMKWMPEVTTETMIKWPYMQAIIGDTADNIQGIKGMGKAAATKAFAGCQTELECWEALVEVYESKGKTSIDALETIRLVHMHQFDGTGIKLFDPRNLKMNNELSVKYKALVREILSYGTMQDCRNGKQLIIPHHSFTINNMRDNHLLQLRKIYLKGIYGEFFTLIDKEPLTNVSQFEANECNYWKAWAGPNGELNLDYYNELHPALENVIKQIKTDPNSRRHVISLWNNEHAFDGSLSLHCCWHNLTFSVINGVLHLVWTQRSVDTMVGLPSDIVLANLFMLHVAMHCSLEIGSCMFSLANVHIYEEHIEGAKELLTRSDEDFNKPLKFELKA